MAVIPTKIPEPPSAAVASFDYTDIASGLGYSTYYGFTDTGGNYRLIDNTSVYSETTGDEVQSGGTPAITKTYTSSTFQLPRDIKGKAIINIPVKGQGTTGVVYASGALIHYDGDTAASAVIGQGNGAAATGADVASEEVKYNCVSFDCTETHVKRGDAIKLKVDIWSTTDNWTITGHDPTNADYSPTAGNDLTETQLKIMVPFKLDL